MFMNCRDMSYRLLQMLGAVAFVFCLPLAILALAILYIVTAPGWFVQQIQRLMSEVERLEIERAEWRRTGRRSRSLLGAYSSNTSVEHIGLRELSPYSSKPYPENTDPSHQDAAVQLAANLFEIKGLAFVRKRGVGQSRMSHGCVIGRWSGFRSPSTR